MNRYSWPKTRQEKLPAIIVGQVWIRNSKKSAPTIKYLKVMEILGKTEHPGIWYVAADMSTSYDISEDEIYNFYGLKS